MKEFEANEDTLSWSSLAQRLLRTGSMDHPSTHPSVDGSELCSDDSLVVLIESIGNSNWQEVNLWDEDDDDQSSSSLVQSNNKRVTCIGMWTEFDMRADDITSEEEDATLGMWKEEILLKQTS